MFFFPPWKQFGTARTPVELGTDQIDQSEEKGVDKQCSLLCLLQTFYYVVKLQLLNQSPVNTLKCLSLAVSLPDQRVSHGTRTEAEPVSVDTHYIVIQS